MRAQRPLLAPAEPRAVSRAVDDGGGGSVFGDLREGFVHRRLASAFQLVFPAHDAAPGEQFAQDAENLHGGLEREHQGAGTAGDLFGPGQWLARLQGHTAHLVVTECGGVEHGIDAAGAGEGLESAQQVGVGRKRQNAHPGFRR